MMGIYCVAEQPLGHQENICSVELYCIILTIDGIVKWHSIELISISPTLYNYFGGKEH